MNLHDLAAPDLIHRYVPAADGVQPCQHTNSHGMCGERPDADMHVIAVKDLGQLDGDWTVREAYLHFTARPGIATGNHALRFALLRQYAQALYVLAARPDDATITTAELREACGIPALEPADPTD